MLKFRAISFPLLLGLFFAMIFWQSGGPILFLIFSALMLFGLTWDLSTMLGNIDMPSYRWISSVVALVFLAVFAEMSRYLLFLPVLILIGFASILFCKDAKLGFRRFFNSLGILTIVGVITIPLIKHYEAGAMNFMFLVLVTKAMDTGGYIVGMSTARLMPNGNHKILPRISPKKSWEGTVGGVVFSVAVALAFYWSKAVEGYSIWWFVVAGVILGIGSLLGDLTESSIKRSCDVKDSGSYIPGMGGAFDVFDSFIYNGVLFVCVQKLSTII